MSKIMSNSKPKKRKRDQLGGPHDIDTSKPTAVFRPSQGRKQTISVALPGSIIANAQSHDLKTSLVGIIARAIAVFCVDEVVVFDDGQSSRTYRQSGSDDDGYTGYSDPNHFMSHLLSYLETPPHLRKHLFPLHPNLRTAGTLPSLDMPHHIRANEWCEFREGVTIPSTEPQVASQQRKIQKKEKKSQQTDRDVPTVHVDVGLPNKVILETPIPPYTRVTVRLPSRDSVHIKEKARIDGEAVAPSVPRLEAGYYWGFNVRSAVSLSAVLTESPFVGGYDLTIGTSERGIPLTELASSNDFKELITSFNHLLLVFGGVSGLEVAVKVDKDLEKIGVNQPKSLFDSWINLLPGQGSRTIRTEEAIWLGLMGLSQFMAK